MGKRAGLLDEVRGIAYISMVIYHLYFDIAFVYGTDLPYAVDIAMKWFQPFIAGTFIFVAGISSNYSSDNFKRGTKYFFLAMMLTFVTSAVMPSEVIVFGVLHFMGIAAMIYGFVGKYTEKIPWLIGMLIFILFYAVTLNVPLGYIGYEGIFSLRLPDALYQPELLFPLGFPTRDFFSGDYFPLIPHFFLFLAGASYGTRLKSGKAAKGIYMTRFGGLAFIGQHGIWIYMLHQPVIMVILELIYKLLGGPTVFL